MLKEKLEQRKCFPTAWGKLIPEEEAYRQLNRQIAAMTANLFQVMRIFEPSWEKRTEAICDIANMMNMAAHRRSRRIMSMLRSMRRSTSRSCAKNRAGSAASPATPATSGRTWRAASCSSRATAWKRNSTPVRGTSSAVSCAT